MPYDGELHDAILTSDVAAALERMMEAVAPIPAFETFYLEHRDAVFAFLRKRVGRDRAEDAFQETFLRALRAYGRLEHGRHLRAWIFTIAQNVATDQLRRTVDVAADVPDLESVDEPLAHDELRALTQELPPKERAAVVLRYGFDLSYADIGDALGSSSDAARQAASAGVRRLRQKGIE
jgi:RNA polymerase sigma factor (sigma-70 family)